jgi:argininosuccinate lyase
MSVASRFLIIGILKGRFFVVNMKKLWQKNNTQLDSTIESFETKGDLLLDQKLLVYDVYGSIAHAKMLKKIGIISNDEYTKMHKGLLEILKLNKKNKFILESGDEDIHTKIENYLTENYGEVGKKIHTGRSRNDQVLTAIRLYSKSELKNIQDKLNDLIKTFKSFSKKYGEIPMPGYTHMQKAMPSSIGLWIDSFVASFEDDIKGLEAAYDLINQSPLGSAAGYGVPIKLDKKYTSELLGFNKVQENPIYCQASRGKFEAFILASLIQILLTINKFASDSLLFTTQEFAFLQPSSSITTGSSIMPQKKNLDIAELLRSKVHLVLGNYMQIVSLSSNLISGYNRDIQDSKKPLMESLEITLESLKATKILLENLVPDKEKLEKAMSKDLFATENALKLVLKGESFRNAYQKIGKEYVKGGGKK